LLAKIEPQLLKKLLSGDNQTIPFIVYLKATTNLAGAVASTRPGLGSQGTADPLAQRTAVVNALQQTARNSQAGVLQTLSGSQVGPTGRLSAAAIDIRPLWIVNAVAAKGSLDLILALAARPDVDIVRLDKEIKIGDWKQPINKIWSPAPSQSLPAALPNGQSLYQWGISKIRADLVYNALGLTGAGVVIGSIDTGVDWLHPALQSKYRGYTGPGKLPQHLGNWFDATGSGAAYPVDTYGHGSHTVGTMVGDNGLGVAPGAQWIAAKAFDSSGGAQSSWLHSAFQWMLAPNGNPALAPDVVNNSWGSNGGDSTEFQADVQALLAAGILPIFSAGNSGPDSATVSSPGSLEIAFAVGATDINDEVALFSSRGPSPWHKTKPEISAPGKNVLSTLPGGAYGELSGTSMAAPHVAGTVALMLQANPGLGTNLASLTYILTSTTVRLGSPTPNNDYGWGRLDAFNAVMAAGSFGTLQGTVTQAGSGLPIGDTSVQIITHAGGAVIYAKTNGAGVYQQGVAANTYDVTVSAFGYQPATAFGLSVTYGVATVQNFALTAKPIGRLTGFLRENGSGLPLVGTISIDGTPAQTTSQADGGYSLTLPEGIYTATVVVAAHRITQAVNLTINDSGTTNQDFWLNPAPKILVVDGGRWYQESQLAYYQQALTDLQYPFDAWQITKPFSTPNDVPVTSTLRAYDIVIWSAPLDSPGYVGAGPAVAGYLQAGGKLLLNGQDVAFYDGGGSIFGVAPYFSGYLKALFRQENRTVFTATGTAAGPLAALALTLNGGDGADNQVSPDVISITNNDFARTTLTYGNGSDLAGIHVGLCVPYRAMFWPFGFEAINTRTDRAAILQAAIAWLTQPATPTGLEVTPAAATVIGNFGQVVSYTTRIRNIGAGSDSYALSLSPGAPYNWPIITPPPPSLTLNPCQSQTITISTQLDITNRWHVSDTRSLTIQSVNQPSLVQTITRTVKTPAPVLLVDDDRWLSYAAEYKQALEANNVPYDYWLVPKSFAGAVPPSPTTTDLQMYPMTIWYTAYDWFQPVTTTEEDRLAAYLNSGGRLMLSSQDYIYNLPEHQPSAFAQTYLGVLAHTEDFSSTQVSGVAGNSVGNQLGPFALTFPPDYANFTDALTPTQVGQIASIGQAGQPNSITNFGLGLDGHNWHTHFLAFGPELLAANDRAKLMQRSLGWLSWLGRSIVTPSLTASLDGTEVTYTALLLNDGWIDLPTATFTATFPAELTPGTASPGFSLVGGDLVWSGSLARNEAKVLTYTATIAGSLPLGTKVRQVSWLAYPEHQILFDRVAEVWVNFPDLDDSLLTVTPQQEVEQGDILTYTLVLKNNGLASDPMVTSTNTLPHMLEVVGFDPPSQGNLITNGKSFTWTTPLAVNEVATLTYRAVISYETSAAIENRVMVADDINDPLNLLARTTYKALPLYFPILYKK
jgi:uncharacterized repeat protein (TIGR01451 family)